MNQEAFQNHLSKNNVKEEQAELFIKKLLKLDEFLQNEGQNIDSMFEGKLMQYTETLEVEESVSIAKEAKKVKSLPAMKR